MPSICSSVWISLVVALPLCLSVINGALSYFLSIILACRLKQQTPTVGRRVAAISLALFHCPQTHIETESRGRAVNTGISGGHLHTCECLNRSALDTGGAQRTIQLCKHAATSFPQLLQALHWDKPLFKQRTQHSCAWAPASCCILTAGLPDRLSRDRYRPYNSQGHPLHTQKGFYRHAKLDSSARNAPKHYAGYFNTDCQSPSRPPTEREISCWGNWNHHVAKWSILKSYPLDATVMTKLEIYLYWYFKYAKCGGQ